MLTPAAKRRRIEAASTTLSKPFRSPFKTPIKPPLDAQTGNDATLVQSASSASSIPTPRTSTPNLSSKIPSLATPRRVRRPLSSPSSAALNNDADIAPLIREQRALEKELREIKEKLDIAEQAAKIEEASRKRDPDGEVDGELVELITKWKGASRLAAEELFGKVRDRVNRMGGPRAWKEMQKKQQEFQGAWDQEESNQQADDEDDDDDDYERPKAEKRDVYAEYSIDVETETENEKSQRAPGVGDTGEMPGQEDEFTMAMMLRTLNVDLDIVGYDREEQRWVD